MTEPSTGAGGTAVGRATTTDDVFGPRVEHMARAIYEAYGVLIGATEAYRWDATDGTISEMTRTKFRVIADDALDKIEWMKFYLAPKDAGE